MMKEYLPLIVDLLIPILMSLVAWLSVSAKKWIDAKVKNEWASGALTRLSDAVFDVVKATEQTMAQEVREAAADGKITTDEAKAIKEHAIDRVKAHVGSKGMDELKRVLDADAIEHVIEDKIEAYLLDRKMDIAALVIGTDGLNDGDDNDDDDKNENEGVSKR